MLIKLLYLVKWNTMPGLEKVNSMTLATATSFVNDEDGVNLLESQDDRFDVEFSKVFERLNAQNKIIEEQKRVVMDMQQKMRIQDKRHQNEIEHFLKMTENGNRNTVDREIHHFCHKENQNDLEVDYEKNSGEFKESEEKQDAIIFDIPAFFALIFRFIYLIVIFIVINHNWSRGQTYFKNKSMLSKIVLSYVAAFFMTLSIFFQSFSARLDGVIEKLSFIYHIAGGIFLWKTYGTYEPGTKQNELLIAGVIVITAELLILFQSMRRRLPKTLSTSHLCGALGVSLLLCGSLNESARSLTAFVFFSFFQSILLLFGLPLTEKMNVNDINCYENETDQASTVADDNESSVSHDEHFTVTEKKNDDNATVAHDDISSVSDNEDFSVTEKKNDDIVLLNQSVNIFESLTNILNQYERRLEILESNNNQSSDDNDIYKPEAKLSPDIYTMMMMSQWTRKSFHNPLSRCKENQEILVIPCPSKAWTLGIVVFIAQTMLGSFALLDQVNVNFGDTILDIPIRVSAVVRVGQFITLILTILTQTDISITYRVLLLLSWKKETWQKLFGHKMNEKSFSFWLGRVVFPTFLKSIQGFVILVTTFIIVIQSDNVVDLLKDFTALFVVSSMDDMFFFMAEHGYLGRSLKKMTKKVTDTSIDEDESNMQCRLHLFLIGITFVLFGCWTTVVVQQRNGSLIVQKYPSCTLEFFFPLIGDGKCDHSKGYFANILDCGWEGGDCLIFNQRYPTCKNIQAYMISDGNCDHGMYNTQECAWDGGDCVGENYPNCFVDNPLFLGNGRCEIEGNTEECGFDGGDCVEFNRKYPNCLAHRPSLIGNGICIQAVNTIECGYDGGDCDEFNDNFPNCNVTAPFKVGDGTCNGGLYDTVECGFDGGDCL